MVMCLALLVLALAVQAATEASSADVIISGGERPGLRLATPRYSRLDDFIPLMQGQRKNGSGRVLIDCREITHVIIPDGRAQRVHLIDISSRSVFTPRRRA